jgi:hypothetical protein
MTYDDVYFSRDDRYSIGTENDSARHYVSILVSNGVFDHDEYYEISAAQYHASSLAGTGEHPLEYRSHGHPHHHHR